MNPDSDNDLYLDGTEVLASYNPISKYIEKLEKLIIPLLIKLAKSPEAYIHWPNRAEVIESQLKKIVAITRGK